MEEKMPVTMKGTGDGHGWAVVLRVGEELKMK